jgi:hypothetical protein
MNYQVLDEAIAYIRTNKNIDDNWKKDIKEYHKENKKA